MERSLLIAAGVTFTTLLVYVAIRRFVAGPKTPKVSLKGKVAIVTGSNIGIGKETARELAGWGARVLCACRSKEKAQQAIKDILATYPDAQVEFWPLDLSSFNSIRQFAEKFNSTEEKLDILVNNAALVTLDRTSKTEEGFDTQMGVNHVGPFLLTLLLLNKLKSAPEGRIVTVSSLGHTQGDDKLVEDFDNQQLTGTDFVVSLQKYCRTKLANMLFTMELQRRLEAKGLAPRVTTNCLHPGGVDTGLDRDAPWYVSPFFRFFLYVFGKTSLQGAQTSLYLATSSEVKGKGGGYYDKNAPATIAPLGKDEKLAQELWEKTVKRVQEHFPSFHPEL